jgi:hypothetical protein
MNVKKSTYIVHDDVNHQGELQMWLLNNRLSSELEIRYRSMFIQLLKLRITQGLETDGNKIPMTANKIP